MLTPLIMLLVMTAPWLAARAWNAARARRRAFDPAGAAAAGLGLLFLLTASGHFFQAEAMVTMLPPWVPARLPLVWATGALEIAIALACFVPATRRAAAWAAVAVLVLFFPANLYAAWVHAPMGGHAWGPAYLLVRAPLQAAIVAWALGPVLGVPRRRRAGGLRTA
jgi:uncharacterized membrane protein